uniref:Protein max n=1 Tax=Felis catus TaxID=9685 RepID=A0ABI8AC32_FELCA
PERPSGTGGGEETRGLWDPHLPPWRRVLRPPAPTLYRSGSGGLGRGAPGIPLSGSRVRGRRSGPAPWVRDHPLPVTRGSWGEEQPRFQSAADKRAHHNALERKRRDHIKDSFHSLRDSVPSLQGEKASRAQILDKATEYIQYMRRKNHTHQQDIDDLKRQNALLEQQVRALEKARSSAQLQTNYPSSDNSLYTNAKGSTISAFDGGSDSSSESEPEEPQSRKKLRMEAS